MNNNLGIGHISGRGTGEASRSLLGGSTLGGRTVEVAVILVHCPFNASSSLFQLETFDIFHGGDWPAECSRDQVRHLPPLAAVRVRCIPGHSYFLISQDDVNSRLTMLAVGV